MEPNPRNCVAGVSNLMTQSKYEIFHSIEHYTRENALLEHKKNMLGMELKEERRACIALQVELRLQQF